MLEGLILASMLSPAIQYERSYINYAWGQSEQYCTIDDSGNVWFESLNQPRFHVRNIPKAELALAGDLANQGQIRTQFEPVLMGADMGDVTWRMMVGQETVLLKIRGNYVGEVESSACEKLTKLIDRWCEGQPGFPDYARTQDKF